VSELRPGAAVVRLRGAQLAQACSWLRAQVPGRSSVCCRRTARLGGSPGAASDPAALVGIITGNAVTATARQANRSLLIRRYPRRRSGLFRSVRDLGLVSPGCPYGSGASEGCSSVWLPAWLPTRSSLWTLPTVFKSFRVTARTVQGMARVRSGQAPAWPLSSDRSVRRGSRVKRDFACTFTRHFSCARCPAVTVTL
jgi:hypothetical protein